MILEDTNEDYDKDLLLEARTLYSIYVGKEGAENVVALRGLNLKMTPGEFITVVGPSGAGKSTLLRTLGGLQKPSAGTVRYHGKDITKLEEEALVPFRRDTVGFIFQEGNLLPTVSAFNNVFNTLRYSDLGITASKKRATEILTRLGLKSRMHALPNKLSGGERQRVAIARALANNPKLILADEPTGNVDAELTESIMGLFKELHNELETGFLIVTHSPHVASFSDRNLELLDGLFIGQHESSSDIYNLEESRSVIVQEDGNLTLPPEILGFVQSYGNLWDFVIEMNGGPKLVAKPKGNGSKQNCSVCKAAIKETDFNCKSCGVRLK